MKSNIKKIVWLILFSVAMGLLEAAVVVYLREIYYPQGFGFPLVVMDQKLIIVELLRETSTVVMLAGIGILAGTTSNQRLAFFLAAFAIWDIFYYVFLKLLLGWPESFLTWDILFLIPVPWVGPVLTPCLVSLTMLLTAGALIHRDQQNVSNKINKLEWFLILVGCLNIIGTWTGDYFSITSGMSLSSKEALLAFSSHVPQYFNWLIFALGEVLILFGVLRFWMRTRSAIQSNQN